MAGVDIYGAKLFTKAQGSSVIKGENMVPFGDSGVDLEVQQNMENIPGICCGITLAWAVGFCHSRVEAQSTAYFKNYFQTLRFQGTYMMQKSAKVREVIASFAENGVAQGVTEVGKKKKMEAFDLQRVKSDLPEKGVVVLGFLHHAIGLGFTSGRYYIMDPNAGLFAYWSEQDFLSDLQEQILARRVQDNMNFDAKMFTHTFKKVEK